MKDDVLEEIKQMRRERKKICTIVIPDTGQKFELERRYATPTIEGIRLFSELTGKGITRYEDICAIANILIMFAGIH